MVFIVFALLILAVPAGAQDCVRISTQGGRFIAEPMCELPEANSFFVCSRLGSSFGEPISCALAPSPLRFFVDSGGGALDDEVTKDTLQEGVTMVIEEGDEPNFIQINRDLEYKDTFTPGQLFAMGAHTTTRPPQRWEFYADNWNPNTTDTIGVRPGRHAWHATFGNAEVFALAPCQSVRAVSVQILHSSNETAQALPSGDSVEVFITKNVGELSNELCAATGPSNSGACLSSIPIANFAAGDTFALVLHCHNGEGACSSATYDVFAQLYCY